MGSWKITMTCQGLALAVVLALLQPALALDVDSDVVHPLSPSDPDLKAFRKVVFATPGRRFKPRNHRVRVISRKDLGDVTRIKLSYLVDRIERSSAWLMVPNEAFSRSGKKYPLVLCPHPSGKYGKDAVVNIYPRPPRIARERAKRGWRSYGLQLAKRGFVTFAPDRPGWGERKHVKGVLYRDYFEKRWPERLRKRGWNRSVSKPVWDLQAGLDMLLKRYRFIDKRRIGAIGHSLGGWDSFFVAAADKRIKAIAVNGGPQLEYIPDLWQCNAKLKRYLRDPQPQKLRPNSNILAMMVAPRPFLLVRGVNDPGYKVGLAKYSWPEAFEDYTRYYVAAHKAKKGRSKNRGNRRTALGGYRAPLALYYHNDAHDFRADSRELAYRWLERHLR